MPIRIQRQRTRGWRMPPNTVYVGRGSRWDNPYRVGTCLIPDAQAAVEAFAANLPLSIDLSELSGKNLACWCPLGNPDGSPHPCHADVLLALTNVPPRSNRQLDALEVERDRLDDDRSPSDTGTDPMTEAELSLQPLFERAEREGLWFFCSYQELWFSPAELRARNAEGRFRWGAVNWELRDPGERIKQLRRQQDQIEDELAATRRRMAGP